MAVQLTALRCIYASRGKAQFIALFLPLGDLSALKKQQQKYPQNKAITTQQQNKTKLAPLAPFHARRNILPAVLLCPTVCFNDAI